jgi:serine protease AprX
MLSFRKHLKPGVKLHLRVVGTVKRDSDVKTLQRLLAMDLERRRLQRRLKNLRKQNYNPQRRGGREYGGRQKKLFVSHAAVGEEAIITYSRETDHSLNVVRKFVELSVDIPEKAGDVDSLESHYADSIGVTTSSALLQKGQESPPRIRLRLPRAVRWAVSFPTVEHLRSAQRELGPLLGSGRAASERFRLMAVEVPLSEPKLDRAEKIFDRLRKDYHALVAEEIPCPLDWEFGYRLNEQARVADDPQSPSLDSVLNLIEARKAWNENRGEGAVIAIVDSGINGQLAEFPIHRRHRRLGWAELNGNGWDDQIGHGTMTACIAAATRHPKRGFEGVAPNATLLSYNGSSPTMGLAALSPIALVEIYERLLKLVREERDKRVIISNSWGWAAWPPGKATDTSDEAQQVRAKVHQEAHDSIGTIISELQNAGAVLVFSAGNDHAGASGAHVPNSIWPHKSHPEVLTVGACDTNGRVWDYSSRGPGAPPANKPDVVAPTPAMGRMLYKNRIQCFPKGWGSSGACPQAAGLCALIATKRPSISSSEMFDAIRKTAVTLNCHQYTQGHGQINCVAAIKAI